MVPSINFLGLDTDGHTDIWTDEQTSVSGLCCICITIKCVVFNQVHDQNINILLIYRVRKYIYMCSGACKLCIYVNNFIQIRKWLRLPWGKIIMNFGRLLKNRKSSIDIYFQCLIDYNIAWYSSLCVSVR